MVDDPRQPMGTSRLPSLTPLSARGLPPSRVVEDLPPPVSSIVPRSETHSDIFADKEKRYVRRRASPSLVSESPAPPPAAYTYKEPKVFYFFVCVYSC